MKSSAYSSCRLGSLDITNPSWTTNCKSTKSVKTKRSEKQVGKMSLRTRKCTNRKPAVQQAPKTGVIM